MAEVSTKPYLIRAIHEWCSDQGYTPYLAVSVDDYTRVPMEYVKGGEIVLNVSLPATSHLRLGNEWIEFQARFNGVVRDIAIPIHGVSAIYARETGHGMAFEVVKPPAETIRSRPEADQRPPRENKGQQGGRNVTPLKKGASIRALPTSRSDAPPGAARSGGPRALSPVQSVAPQGAPPGGAVDETAAADAAIQDAPPGLNPLGDRPPGAMAAGEVSPAGQTSDSAVSQEIAPVDSCLGSADALRLVDSSDGSAGSAGSEGSAGSHASAEAEMPVEGAQPGSSSEPRLPEAAAPSEHSPVSGESVLPGSSGLAGVNEPADSSGTTQPAGTSEPIRAPEPTGTSEPIRAPEPAGAAEPIRAPETAGTSEPIRASEPAGAAESIRATELPGEILPSEPSGQAGALPIPGALVVADPGGSGRVDRLVDGPHGPESGGREAISESAVRADPGSAPPASVEPGALAAVDESGLEGGSGDDGSGGGGGDRTRPRLTRVK